jgi:hypothetical protein
MLNVPYHQLNGKTIKNGIQHGSLQKITQLARKLSTNHQASLSSPDQGFILRMRKMMDEVCITSQRLCAGVTIEDDVLGATARSMLT